MNSNAKWTIFSVLAMAALGAGALAVGCSSSSSDNGTNGVVTTPGGSSNSGYTGPICQTVNPSYQVVTALLDACKACYNTTCCPDIQACFDMDPAQACDGSETCAGATCYSFAKCNDQCAITDPGDENDCLTQCNDSVTWSDGHTKPIYDAYQEIYACLRHNCSEECFGLPSTQ
ncbi:MAG: hypothetical protein FWD73_08525 [Polyangiaceae bacterium]|nr:hypothetical protein [Polyangiaceae bacterium]